MYADAPLLGTGDPRRWVEEVLPLPLARLLVDPDLYGVVLVRVHIDDVADAIAIPVGKVEVLAVHPLRRLPDGPARLPPAVRVVVGDLLLATVDVNLHLASLEDPHVVHPAILVAHHVAVLVAVDANLGGAVPGVLPHAHVEMVLLFDLVMLHPHIVLLGQVAKCGCFAVDACKVEPLYSRGIIVVVDETLDSCMCKVTRRSLVTAKRAVAPGNVEAVTYNALPTASRVGESDRPAI